MQAMLEEMNALPGVAGCFTCDPAGQVLDQALPGDLLAVDLGEAAAAVAEALPALHTAAGKVSHLDLYYAQRRLIIRPISSGALVLICEKGINPKLLVPAVTEAVKRHGQATVAQAAPARVTPPPRPAPAPSAPVRAAATPGAPTSRRNLLIAGGALALALALVAFGAWLLAPNRGASPAAPASTAAAPAAVVEPKVVLRLGGAKAFAAELAPALAKAFLESLPAKDVKISKLETHRFRVQGLKDGAPLAIDIEGLNTPDGFDQLAAGKLDLAMAGRRIKPEWQAKLDTFGPMMVPGREHVVALSGMAIIVNQSNQVPQLSRAQLADIFSGTVTDWAQLGVKPGPAGGSPIHVYSGDDKIGITDLFRTFVLDKRGYAGSARRFGTVKELNDAVAADPQGIGYVFLPFVRGTRAVPISEGDESPLLPTAFTLATEDYFLTHRVYFYVLPKVDNPLLSQFMQFVLGGEGQGVVKKAGYVELSVASAPREPPPNAPPEFVRLTRGATRLSSTFRFETASADFDTRSLVDLERVTAYLVENRLNGEAVRVLGFADAQGRADVNLDLSQARARQVAKALAQRGITGIAVDAFGAALPVASNATPDGRQRNRRVEVWVAR